MHMLYINMQIRFFIRINRVRIVIPYFQKYENAFSTGNVFNDYLHNPSTYEIGNSVNSIQDFLGMMGALQNISGVYNIKFF